MNISLWIVCHNRPFAIVEDDALLDIFNDLNNKCITPSASTVSRDMKEIFQMTRKKIAAMLRISTLFRCCGIIRTDEA
jgi:hypothetical protein